MHALCARATRHFALATLAVSSAAAPASAAVAYTQTYFPIPANIDGLYINVESLQTGSAGSTVAGWDINPYSATNLTWFNATGSGMMRYPGVTTGSAGSLDFGMSVSGAESFGAGAVAVGANPGNWRLNSMNLFGFRFVAADGLTHYGWGSFWIGATINSADRYISELAWETTPGTPIMVGDRGRPANDDREHATVIPLGGAISQAETWNATASPDPLPGPADCARLDWCNPMSDIWFRIEPNSEPGLLGLSLCNSNFDTAVIVYRLDTATNTLEMVASDRDSCCMIPPYCQSGVRTPRIERCYLSADNRPTLIRVQAGATIEMQSTWTPLAGPAFIDGALWIGGATFSEAGADSAFASFEPGLVAADASGGTGSGLAGSWGYLAGRVVSDASAVKKITMLGYIEGRQPREYFADSNFRVTTAPTDGSGPDDPLIFVVPSDSYFRISGTGVAPILSARTGCVCGDRLLSGTYALSVSGFGVVLGSNDIYVSTSMDWTLELSPTPFTIPGDVDGDGRVNGNDLSILLASWGGTGAADLDRDGTVGGGDLGLLLTGWTG